MKILLVDDDQYIVSMLSAAMKSDQYQIEATNSGSTALELVKAFEYDLLIVDVMIPGIEGINLCHQLRLAGYQMPIMILSAKDSTQDRIRGLEAGADDYLVKPFEISELIARIHALSRRRKEILPQILTWGKLQLDTINKKVSYAEKSLHLTPKEYALLEIFLSNQSRIFSRDALLNRIWSNDYFPSEEAVTTQIKGLRKKLKSAGMTVNLIQTIYGLGYRLKEQEKVKESIDKYSIQQPTKQENQQPAIELSGMDKSILTSEEIKTMAMIASLHLEYQKNLKQKLELFLQVVLHLLTNIPDQNLLQQAEIEAHRLTGSLGSFGLHESSKVAGEIEILLQNRANAKDQREVAYQLKKLTKKLEITLQESPSTSNIINNLTSLAAPAELLIIDDDVELAQRITLEAKIWGLQVKFASSLETAKALIAQNMPDVILLDLFFPNHQENGLNFLAEFKAKKPEIPILIFTANNQLIYRVNAAKLGVSGFLNKNMGISEVLSIIRELLKQKFTSKLKVMVVDDDHIVLRLVKALLSNRNIQVIILQDASKFWDLLEATHPDLLILDVKMPEFSGIDLCQVVRNDPKWNHLPILFMSGLSAREINTKFSPVGADDYVQKPIIESEFVPRVLNRLELIKQRQILR